MSAVEGRLAPFRVEVCRTADRAAEADAWECVSTHQNYKEARDAAGQQLLECHASQVRAADGRVVQMYTRTSPQAERILSAAGRLLAWLSRLPGFRRHLSVNPDKQPGSRRR